MNQVCKYFRDAIANDVLIWLNIIVERRLGLHLTDETLIKIAFKVNGRLQILALLNCVRIMNAGLMSVVNENPHISKVIHSMIQLKLHLIFAREMNSTKFLSGLEQLTYGWQWFRGLFGHKIMTYRP